MPVTWCLAGPELGERDVAQELLGHARDIGALRNQMIVLSDKGLAGREMERYAAGQIHVLLARPDRKGEKRRFGNLAGMRQWVEAIIGTLKLATCTRCRKPTRPRSTRLRASAIERRRAVGAPR
jgi:hypothetical protein